MEYMWLLCLLGGGFLCSLIAVFHLLKSETASLSSRMKKERLETLAAVELLRANLARLDAGLTEMRVSREVLDHSQRQQADTANAIGAIRRGRILQMHYRGDPIDKIVSALGVSRREVELLLQIQKTSPPSLRASA